MEEKLTEGLLLVDKEVGISSFDVVRRVRKSLKTKKVGHTGTLDPLASGLMVILIGRYTKLCDHITAQDKTYLATVEFGKSTTTDDAEGEVVSTGDPSRIDQGQLENVVSSFLGQQMQVPPVFSAISIAGERAYKKARRNEKVDMPTREIVVHQITVESYKSPLLTLRINCSKGTYIRSIARDLGAKMGVPAHLKGLRRLSSGEYDLKNAVPSDKIADLKSVEPFLKTDISAIFGIEKLEVSDKVAYRLKLGQRPRLPEPLTFEKPALIHCQKNIVGLAVAKHGILKSVRGF